MKNILIIHQDRGIASQVMKKIQATKADVSIYWTDLPIQELKRYDSGKDPIYPSKYSIDNIEFEFVLRHGSDTINNDDIWNAIVKSSKRQYVFGGSGYSYVYKDGFREEEIALLRPINSSAPLTGREVGILFDYAS